PFGMSELSSGYMAVAEAEEGKGGEMKCGASMMKDGEMKCGANMMQKSEEKMGEGSCAGNKPAAAEKKAEDSSGAAESGGE
ncbi:MAG: low-complexity protein, partial [Pseudomonadota bacterium]